ncbi:MAG: hypothetical protein KatS3mg109_0996 [Pirellulaceae bacterium]|nr:MAG: hypothetical protein KatS3mg109_0996 [Pirellulaceae bacterium]
MTHKKFRLGTLLKLRQMERDQARQRYLQAVRAQEILQQQIQQLDQQRAFHAEAARHSHAPGPVDVDRLLEQDRYGMVLEQQRRHAQGQLEQISTVVSSRQQEWAAAQQRVKMLEKLRERKEAERRRQESRQEQKRLDEMAGR